MKHIRAIGKKLCAFSCDYAVKVRHVSQTSDFKVWAHCYDYSRLANRAVCMISGSHGTITAFADKHDFLFRASPFFWPGLAVWMKQTESQCIPGILLRQAIVLSSTIRASARIEFSSEQSLPRVKGSFGYSRGACTVRLFPAFSLNNGYYGVTGSARVAVRSRGILGQYVLQKSASETTQGLMFNSPYIDVGFLLGGKGQLFCEGRIGPTFAAGFQIAELLHSEHSIRRAFASSSLGWRGHFGNGYFGANWRAPRSLAWKFKYLFEERCEVGVIGVINNYEFGKSLFSFSVCIYSDGSGQAKNRPRPRPPDGWKRDPANDAAQ